MGKKTVQNWPKAILFMLKHNQTRQGIGEAKILTDLKKVGLTSDKNTYSCIGWTLSALGESRHVTHSAT